MSASSQRALSRRSARAIEPLANALVFSGTEQSQDRAGLAHVLGVAAETVAAHGRDLQLEVARNAASQHLHESVPHVVRQRVGHGLDFEEGGVIEEGRDLGNDHQDPIRGLVEAEHVLAPRRE